jgi:hypothetical protein
MKLMAAAVAVLAATSAAAEPLIFDNGRLFIQARVNGVPTEALLDSAAEASLIAPVFASKAKIPEGAVQTIKGSAGEAKARIAEGVTIEALGEQIRPEAVVVTDLSELSHRLIKRPTQVVVGRELFDAARLGIDIAHGQVSVLDRNSVPRGKQVPLTKVHGVEAVPVFANGTFALAELDLGNGSDVLISRPLATKLKLKIVGKKAGGGIGGEIQRDMVRIDSVDVAGRRFRNVLAAIDDQPTAGDMNIGTSILKHFLVTTDFGQRAAWLEPAL